MVSAPQNAVADGTPRYRLGYLLAISLVAALGGLLFGYDWVVISGAKMFYEKDFQLTSAWLEGWATSCATLGCLLGAVVAGGLSDRYGRKRLLILAGGLFVATGVGVALARDMAGLGGFTWFVIFRMLGGVGIGLASNISPVYIAEISPAEVRGRFVALNQLAIVIGVLGAQCANWLIDGYGSRLDARILAASAAPATPQTGFAQRFIARYGPRIPGGRTADFLDRQQGAPTDQAIAEFLAGEKIKVPAAYLLMAHRGLTPWSETRGWRWMFGAVAIPGLLLFLAMFCVPESPRWLIKNGRVAPARCVLAKIGGPAFADREAADIQATLVNEVQKVDFRELLEPRMRKILFLGVVLAVLQQWCGINCIFYYADKVFGAAGFEPGGVLQNIVMMGGVSLVFTLIAIATVERLGRRRLMLLGTAGLAATFALLGTAYLCGVQGVPVLLLVLAGMAWYSLTLAPITWVILSEIFPNRIRGAAMSVSVFALWLACFVAAQLFPIAAEANLGGSCLGFSAVCAFGFWYVLARLPETKGKSLEQIERELVD
jgi:SP family sugar porter-like MFS transporter